MYGTNSKEIVQATDDLIKNYGMEPFSAYELVYAKSAEMSDVFEISDRIKKELQKELQKRITKKNVRRVG